MRENRHLGISGIKNICLLLFLIFSFHAIGQNPAPIDADRPDQSDGVFTLPKRIFQVETGLISGMDNVHYFQHNTMVRYGLFARTEMRLEFDYRKQSGTVGIMPVNLSVKQRLTEQQGIFPAVTAVGNISLPFLSSPAFKPAILPFGMTLACENTLSDRFTFAYNLGIFLDGERNLANWLATTNMGYAPMEKLSFFLEYYADFGNAFLPDLHMDAGVLVLIRPNLQLDLAAGTKIFHHNTIDRFITLGLSYRFDP